jgi:hypothetical protein
MVELLKQEQIQVPDFAGAYHRGVEASQMEELRKQALESKTRENQLNNTSMQLGQLYTQGNADAGRQLAAINPDYAKKVTDQIYQKSERAGAYASTIINAPEAKRAAVHKYIVGQINAGKDPFLTSKDLQEAGISDDYTSDQFPKLYAIAQGHRKLEDALKAPKEAADLEQTKAKTSETYVDIAKKRAETLNIGLEGQLKAKELAGQKPLSGEAAKTSTIAAGGISAVRDLRQILGKSKLNKLAGASVLPNAFQDAETQQFGVLRNDFK